MPILQTYRNFLVIKKKIFKSVNIFRNSNLINVNLTVNITKSGRNRLISIIKSLFSSP